MKLLLTSAGIKNERIHDALLAILGKPIADCHALCIPTAGYGHPMCTPDGAWRFIAGKEPQCPMCELGWKSLGVLELTALPSIDKARWEPWVRQADVLLVNGGDAMYLSHWMRQSGLADLLESLPEIVWVGLSAGSMVMTPRVGEGFAETKPPSTGDDIALGVVDFSIFPHLDHPDLPDNTMAAAERWAAGLGCPAYAIDDQTAIKVVDGAVEVVSEGHWKSFGRSTVERKSERELVLTRGFDAPARIVFEAWTQPELFRRWWAPKSTGASLLSCEMDVRVGGRYRLEFGHGASEPMAFFGRYIEATPHSRLVWTNDESEDGAVTTVTFEEKGGKTLLVLHELHPSKQALDGAVAGMECGMAEQFEQLDELLVALGASAGR